MGAAGYVDLDQSESKPGPEVSFVTIRWGDWTATRRTGGTATRQPDQRATYPCPVELTVLAEQEWRDRADAHAARLERYLAPHLARRRAHLEHPVHDFLFTYYSYRPAQLRRWHPGFGTAVAGPAAQTYAGLKGYATHDDGTVAVTAAHAQAQRPLVEQTHALLVATASRAPSYGCLGLHEWAMVYRLEQSATRHAAWPLRLGGAGTDAVVEAHRVACSHFDAFRFFTQPARPLNTLQPGCDDRVAFEQPGCLHATMDLYKHAYRLSPLVASELVADAFVLAWEVRELDMRASPYDLSALGYEPVRIETPEGKQEYAAAQRAFAERAAPLRRRLTEACERLLAASPPSSGRLDRRRVDEVVAADAHLP